MKHSHQGKQRTQSKYKGVLNAKMFLCAFFVSFANFAVNSNLPESQITFIRHKKRRYVAAPPFSKGCYLITSDQSDRGSLLCSRLQQNPSQISAANQNKHTLLQSL